MQQHLHQIEVSTKGPGFTRLNGELNRWIRSTGMQRGVLHLSCLHTSCSLTINENADPRVLKDLQAWMDAVVPQDGRGPLDGNGKRTPWHQDGEYWPIRPLANSPAKSMIAVAPSRWAFVNSGDVADT